MVSVSIFIFSILLTIILTVNFYMPLISLLQGWFCPAPPPPGPDSSSNSQAGPQLMEQYQY